MSSAESARTKRPPALQAFDRNREDIGLAALAFGKAYGKFIDSAAAAATPPEGPPPDVIAALKRYRAAVARAKQSVSRTRGGSEKRKSLVALEALDGGLQGMEVGLQANYRDAAAAVETGRKNMTTYLRLVRPLRRLRK